MDHFNIARSIRGVFGIAGLLAGFVSSASDAAPPTETAAAPDEGLQEIVVSVEKTPSSLERTPAAVTAVSGEELVAAGVSSALDLADLVPGVTFRTRGPVTQMFIRGVGSNVDSPQVLPAVATQLNQVYMPREATGGSFFDLASVELLPGPQGTLYGRDAAGGTVNVNFNKPTRDPSTDLMMELGAYSMVHVTAVENTPLSDTVAVRLAVDVNRHNGYLSNGADDLASSATRLSVLATPIEELSVLLWGSYWEDDGHGPEVVASPLIDKSNPWAIPDSVPPGSNLFRSYMFGSELNWHLSFADLTYIPGFSHYEENSYASFAAPALALNAPNAAFTLHIDQHWNNDSQELRLGSDAQGPLKWLAGLYWYDQGTFYDRHQINSASGVDSTVISIPSQINSGYAGFGQVTYSPFDQLHFTTGLRAASDRVNVGGVNAVPRTPFDFEHDWSHVDWKEQVQWEFNDKSNVYATVQTGFLRGGYSPAALSSVTHLVVPTTAVEPEKLLSYIVGTKNRIFDNRLQINDEFFYYDYKDYQISAINLTTNVSSFYNAQKAEIFGNQLDITALLTQYDELSLSLSYDHGRAIEFDIPSVGNFAGYSLPNSPDYTAVLGYQHSWILPNSGDLKFRGDIHYESQSFLLYNHPNGSRQAPYTNSGVSLTYHSANSKWDIGLWAKNLEDKPVYGAGATVGPIGAVYLGEPRTYGLRFGVHY